MNTQEIILEIEKLPPKERRAVIQYFERDGQEKYSEEDVSELIDRKKDAEQGINMSDCVQGEDITAPLKKLLSVHRFA